MGIYIGLLLSFQYARYIVNEYDQRLTVRLEVLQVDSVYRRYYVSAMHSIQVTVTIRTREESAKSDPMLIIFFFNSNVFIINWYRWN